MTQSDRAYLAHMHRYAETATRLLGSRGPGDLRADDRTLLSVCYAVLTIGEAASKVSAETRSGHPEIPWTRVIGMVRHHLVHSYETIRVDVIVATVRNELPSLIALIRRALEDHLP
jgi:uncharacterized protein with HEPN domain